MVFGIVDYLVMRQQQSDLLRQAANDRLVRQAKRSHDTATCCRVAEGPVTCR